MSAIDHNSPHQRTSRGPSRPSRLLARVAPAAAIWTALSCADGAADAHALAGQLDGTYRVASAGQTLSLVLQSEGERVAGRLFGPTVTFDLEGEAALDEEGDLSVEGFMTGGGATSLFSFFPDEDGDFGLLVTPIGPGNVPLAEQAAYYAASRVSREVEGAIAPEPGARATVPIAAGHPLVGTWASQVAMSTPGGTIATQLMMELRPDGIMLELGSRSMAGFGDGHADTGFESGGEQARWRTEGDVLVVSYQGSPWIPFARFQVDGVRLALTYLHDGSLQLWYRQGG